MIFKLKYYFGYLISFFFSNKNNNFILMYHDISLIECVDKFTVSLSNMCSQLLFLKDRYNLVEISLINKKSKSFAVTFDDGFESIYNLVFPFIKKNNIKITLFLTLNNLNKHKYLKTNQITEMLKSGLVTIGCHGKTHTSLKSLNDDSLLKEIIEPKKYLENLFNINISYLSFPNGKYDLNTLKFCENNFKKTFSSHMRTINLDKYKDNFIFPRICVYKYDSNLILLNKSQGKFDIFNINPNE